MKAHDEDPQGDDFSAQLSAYLDGELSAPERSHVEARLAADAQAARLLADLQSMRELARALPQRMPERDLWPAIAQRLPSRAGAALPGHDAAPARAEVTPQRTDAEPHRTASAAAPHRRPRRYQLSMPQLATAAALLIAISAGLSAWFTTTLQRHQLPAQRPSVGVTAEQMAASFGGRAPDFAEHQYERAIRELQTVFQEGRGQIDSTTLAKLEKNLALLDAAVTQARQALRDNPDDAYLTAHLAGTMQRKLKLLRQASSLANPMI
jgi:hypothetical protein